MLLYCRRPDTEQITDLVHGARWLPFTYPEVGATAKDLPPGYNIDRNEVVLGEGAEVFRKAVNALAGWKMFAIPWLSVHPPCPRIEAGTTLAILASHFGLWSLNPCRIVYTIDTADVFGFAYGTLWGHAEIGEERFTVEIDQNSDKVRYRILAFSKPGFPARLIGSVARNLQKRFAQDSLAAMTAAVWH
jgi:uncharacterized protein (UPF0548 family)